MATIPKDRIKIDTNKLAQEALIEIEETEKELKIIRRNNKNKLKRITDRRTMEINNTIKDIKKSYEPIINDVKFENKLKIYEAKKFIRQRNRDLNKLKQVY